MSSWHHGVHLQIALIISPEPPPCLTTAPGHGKSVVVQVSIQPGPDNIAQITGNIGNYTNPIGDYHVVQRPGNRAADQGMDSQFHQFECFLNQWIFREGFPGFLDNLLRFMCHHVNMLGGIEDRRDSFVPVCECCFDRPNPDYGLMQYRLAMAMPIFHHTIIYLYFIDNIEYRKHQPYAKAAIG